jgi:ketosteroid isomerase-like protein
MHRKTTALIAALTASFTLPAADHKQAVLTAQHRWLDSYNLHDATALAAIEADDFRVVFGDGRVQTKADQMTNIHRTLPPGAAYEIAAEVTEVRIYGNAAVLTGIVVEKGAFPDKQGALQSFKQRSRYTDTWILQGGRWRVVSSHLSDLKEP